MEKNSEHEISKDKIIKNSKSRNIYNQKNLKNSSNKIIKPKKSLHQKLTKREDKSKIGNISNKSLTDWNKKKLTRKILNKFPKQSKLYIKKRVPPSNNNCLINIIKKKQLSCTQEAIEKYTKKVVYEPKNLLKKKNISNDLSKFPDIDLEIEKDLGNDEDDTMHVHIPHVSRKKKYNFYFELQKTEMKSRNDTNINNSFRIKLHDKIYRTKNRLVLLSKVRNKSIINQYDNKNGLYNNNKKFMRAKTEKKKYEIKKNNNHYNIHKYLNNGNSFFAFRNFKWQNNIRNKNINKESEINKHDDTFNSLNNLDTNKDTIIDSIKDTNGESTKSKTIEYYLLNSQDENKKTHINKNINISFVDNQNLNENNINNKTIFINTNSDFISGKETSDSPENIIDKEEDKFSLPIHKINHFFIVDRKRCQEKYEINSKSNKLFFLSPSQDINLNLDSTDENCYAHKANISVNYTHNNQNNYISSYRKNMNRFKNLSSERKLPLSLFISPSHKNNLFKEKNNKTNIINSIKNKVNSNNSQYILELYKNSKIKLINFLMNVKDNKFKICIESFLDKKSLLMLSSLNKIYYRNVRFFLFKYLYNKCISSNKRKNDKNNFVMKIIHSIFNYSSNKLKNKKDLKYVYNINKTNSEYEKDILKDLTRTFPNDKSFSKDSKNYKKLYNILTCYSNYNKYIGYAQGLNFIGAIAIYIFESEEEEKIFLFLDSLINRFGLGNYFGIVNNNLINKLMDYSNVLNRHIPDIISYFDKQQINHDFFSTGWILTLFSNSMKREYLIISWAFMIIFGWKFFYSFVIQILKFYKDDIFKTDVNELCHKMKGILAEEKFYSDYNDIIKKTFSFMNKNIAL